jgi:uncharacterized membrane protein HdeD (DUF308 family)
MKGSLRIQPQELTAYWSWFLAWGVLVALLGLFAISAATFTTLASIVFIGFILVMGGCVIFVDTLTFWWKRWPGFIMHMIMSLIYLTAGLMLINSPAAGSALLTMIMAIFFILVGASRITYSLSIRVSRWQWTFVNGFISLLLGILIITNLPAASLYIIGLFVGIDLLFCGIAYIMIALSAKKFIVRSN